MNPELGYYIIDIDKIIASAQRAGRTVTITNEQKVAMTKFIIKDILSRRTPTQVVLQVDVGSYEYNFEEPFVITTGTYVYRTSNNIFSTTKEVCYLRMNEFIGKIKLNLNDSIGTRWFYFFPQTTNGYGRSVSVDLSTQGLDLLGKVVVYVKNNHALYLSSELLTILNHSYSSASSSAIA